MQLHEMEEQLRNLDMRTIAVEQIRRLYFRTRIPSRSYGYAWAMAHQPDHPDSGKFCG